MRIRIRSAVVNSEYIGIATALLFTQSSELSLKTLRLVERDPLPIFPGQDRRAVERPVDPDRRDADHQAQEQRVVPQSATWLEGCLACHCTKCLRFRVTMARPSAHESRRKSSVLSNHLKREILWRSGDLRHVPLIQATAYSHTETSVR